MDIKKLREQSKELHDWIVEIIGERNILWIKGLIGAGFGSVTQSIGNIIYDSNQFNLTTKQGISNLISVCWTGFLVGAFLYMKQSPLPITKTIETQTQTLTIKTTEETKIDGK